MKVQCPHVNDQANFTKSLQGHKIYKDQCARCFQEPKDDGGIYICMKCFNSFCHSHLAEHHKQFKHVLYTNFRMQLVQSQEQEQVITKLAIGKEGGALAGDEYKNHYTLFCFECDSGSIENEAVLEPQIKSLINTDSPFKKQALIAWENQIYPCQHTLMLEQNPQNKDLTKCSQCDLSTNLWLCLTCGSTGCGRKNYDGSGGNNHGIEHYENTKHPVVVKLGTITTQGEASLYCYQCNNEVKDDSLHNHLGVLGINVASQKKTEKTMAELELELNLNFTLSKLLEDRDGKDKPLYGAGFTGMNNIGNSCYLNSVVQTLNSLPEWQEVYEKQGASHMKECNKLPESCFYCQIAKVSVGLNSGKYGEKIEKSRIINGTEQKWECQKGVSPYDFKLLVAEGNQEFLSARQQDALEYLQIVFDRLNKEEPNYNKNQNIPKLFDYENANKLVCTKCHGYKLITNETNEWKFPVPPPTKYDEEKYYQEVEKEIDPEIKKSKQSQDPEYDVDFKKCLDSLKMGDAVSLNCPECKSEQVFTSKNYFKSTPRYLLSVASRFILDNWVPKKLNPIIQIDEKLNIEEFLLENSKEGNKLIEEAKSSSNKKYSEENVPLITDMGYSRNAAIRALIAQKDNAEAAIMWIMENMDNPQLNDPIQEESSSGPNVDPGALAQVIDMGFEDFQAKIALIKHKSNVPAAIEWLFNSGGDVSGFMDLLEPPKEKKEEGPKKVFKNYELFAVIVHLGKSIHHGHYVAYIKRGQDWILFNDEKVSNPVKAMIGKGFLYLWRGVE